MLKDLHKNFVFFSLKWDINEIIHKWTIKHLVWCALSIGDDAMELSDPLKPFEDGFDA